MTTTLSAAIEANSPNKLWRIGSPERADEDKRIFFRKVVLAGEERDGF